LKKITIVKWIGIILFLIYISMLVIDIVFNILGDLKIIIFSLLLALISINLIAKGVLLKSSSTMWFALTLILFAIVIAGFELNSLNSANYYFVFSIIPIISSLINLAIFKNLIYIKVIILNISIIIPTIVSYFVDLELYFVFAIAIFCVIMGIVLCRSINLNKEIE